MMIEIVLFPISLSIPMVFPSAKTNESHKSFTSWFRLGTSEKCLPNGSVWFELPQRVNVQTIYSTPSLGNVHVVLVSHCGVSLTGLFTRGANSQ